MAAFALENGADLNVVSAYLSSSVDEDHTEVFSDMLASARVVEVSGLKIGLCVQPVRSGLTMLAGLVARYREFKGLNAAMGVFSTDFDKCMVIGRSGPRGIDVGLVMRRLGGGGHPGAGSAVVRGVPPHDLVETVMAHVRESVRGEVLVGDIMSRPEPFMTDGALTMAGAESVMSLRRVSALMVCEEGRFQGALYEPDISRAVQAGRPDTPVKGCMKKQIPRLQASQNARHALDLMNRSAEGALPVVEGDLLVGVLTRGDLLLELYDI
jgi:predicted transcriptional regulator